MIVSSTFDPITKREIDEIKKLHKNHRRIYIHVKKEGILDLKTRIQLVKKAIRPYHYLSLTDKDSEYIISYDEEIVRNGYYALAAYGIQKDLWSKGYYFKETVNYLCTPKRAAHSLRVAQCSKEIAHAHHLDENLAYVIGCLHDITKKVSDEDNEKIIKIYKPEWLSLSPKIWHSYTATIFLKQYMNCYNDKILHAIEHHTLGDGHNVYDMIVYIADKIEPGRNYDTTKHKQLACKNLRKAVDLVQYEGKLYRKKIEDK